MSLNAEVCMSEYRNIEKTLPTKKFGASADPLSLDTSDILFNVYQEATKEHKVVKKIKRMKSCSPPRHTGKSPSRHKSPPKVNLVTPGNIINMNQTVIDNSSNIDEVTQQSDSVTQLPQALPSTTTLGSSITNRATSQGKQAHSEALVEQTNVASPRYKFDPESRKFVLDRRTSPVRRIRMKFEPEQVEKRNYTRWLIDGYAMQILAPALNPEKH